MIRKNKIFMKFFIAMFVSMLFFSIVFSFYYVNNQKSEILKTLQLKAKSIANLIIYIDADAIVVNDNSFIVEFNNDFIFQDSLLKTIIINRENKDYYIVRRGSWEYKKSLSQEYKQNEKNKISTIALENKESFIYTQPINISGVNWGYIHLNLSLKDYEDKVHNMYVSFSIFIALLFLITLCISYLVARGLSKPITQLNDIAKEVTKGNMNVRSEYENDDEIGQLSNSFNKMIYEINDSQLKLTESHEKLEERVKKRTIKLNQTNEQLKNKTLELEDLNKSLDEKVKKEVEKRTSQEKILIQQSRLIAIGDLIGNIAHQWRQPLSIISTAASGIKVEKEFGLSSHESEIQKLDCIVETSNFLSGTIKNLNEFFISSNKKEDFNLKEKIENSIDLLAATLDFHNIIIEKDIPKNIIVNGLSNEYSQVIMNILSNAKDALFDRNIVNAKITLRLKKDKKYSILEISDNAGGICETIIDKIFDPYFTTKHKSQGVGIGLYMSKMIIEKKMDGVLSVENTDIGAKFIIKVPFR